MVMGTTVLTPTRHREYVNRTAEELFQIEHPRGERPTVPGTSYWIDWEGKKHVLNTVSNDMPSYVFVDASGTVHIDKNPKWSCGSYRLTEIRYDSGLRVNLFGKNPEQVKEALHDFYLTPEQYDFNAVLREHTGIAGTPLKTCGQQTPRSDATHDQNMPDSGSVGLPETIFSTESVSEAITKSAEGIADRTKEIVPIGDVAGKSTVMGIAGLVILMAVIVYAFTRG